MVGHDFENWEACVEQAAIDVTQMSEPPQSKDDRNSLTLFFAEKYAILSLVMPPHWTGAYNCAKCGHMPAPKGVELNVTNCPWCDSTVSDFRKPEPYGHVKLKLLLTGECA